MTGKRKRQESFQSRKRQAATATPSTSNQAPLADVAQHPAMNGNTAAASKAQLNEPVQHGIAAAVNTTAACASPSTAQATMQTSHQNDLVAIGTELQDAASLGAVADTISPARVTAPLPIAQPETQAVGLSNGQSTTPRLQEAAKGTSQAMPTPQQYVVSKPVNDARGHTGYLTFARRSVDD